MPTLRDRLHDPELAATLAEALGAVQYSANPAALAEVAIACIEPALHAGAPTRQFIPAHLGVVYLLADQQGSTHTRLRRLWDARAARVVNPWPWISESGLRTRCSELVAWGLVEDSGARGETQGGRPSTIWQLVGVDPRKIGRELIQPPGVDPGTYERLEELLLEAGDDTVIRSQLLLVDYLVGIRRPVRA